MSPGWVRGVKRVVERPQDRERQVQGPVPPAMGAAFVESPRPSESHALDEAPVTQDVGVLRGEDLCARAPPGDQVFIAGSGLPAARAPCDAGGLVEGVLRERFLHVESVEADREARAPGRALEGGSGKGGRPTRAGSRPAAPAFRQKLRLPERQKRSPKRRRRVAERLPLGAMAPLKYLVTIFYRGSW